ncbi:MAG: thermonuclease family protein [Deltaproteobacteria bacterium]|nr:thermonuclease family protein [Deltaproteobacteria bacterium]
MAEKYNRIVVQLPVRDLATRHFAENRFATEARRLGLKTKFIPNHSLFFPGTEYTAEQVDAILEANSVGAVLLLGIANVGTTQVYVPRSYVSYTSGIARVRPAHQSPPDIRFNSTTVGAESGGYYESAPWAMFDMTLVDAHSGEVPWIATAQTMGKVVAGDLDLLGSFVERGAYTLALDGYLELLVVPTPIGDQTKSRGRKSRDSQGRFQILTVEQLDSWIGLEGVRAPPEKSCESALAAGLGEIDASIVDGKPRIYYTRHRGGNRRVYVFRDSGELLNLALVEAGLARAADRTRLGPGLALRFEVAEKGARESRLGMWANSRCVRALSQ